MYIFAAVVVVLAVSAVLMWPHVAAPAIGPVRELDVRLRELFDEKERLLRTVKDLDFDFKTGKVSAEDFKTMRGSVARELKVVLDSIESIHNG